jgi:methyl-accepting chemotaxis protein
VTVSLENLHSAKVLITEAGSLQIGSGPTVGWEARNQFTKETSKVSLPSASITGKWLGQVREAETRVPVVDAVRRITKATSTIFQRMNPQGDMRRVATNVIGEDGKRAIGTFIPATGPDGQPSAVVSTVLRKEAFVGRAFVVNGWYMAAYESLTDTAGNVIGMIYVGEPEAIATEPLRREIARTRIGRSGHVFVLNAAESTRGHYVVSQDRKRDGENLWDAHDGKGTLFVQEICRRLWL